MELTVTISCRDSYTVLTVAGEVDLCTAPELGESIDQVIASGGRWIAIDLNDCSYFDSDGIKILVRTWRALGSHGRIVVCTNNGMPRKALSVSGVNTLFPVIDSLEQLSQYPPNIPFTLLDAGESSFVFQQR